MSDFFYMGGFAGYVWSAYCLASCIIIGNYLWTWRANKRTKVAIRKWQQRDVNDE